MSGEQAAVYLCLGSRLQYICVWGAGCSISVFGEQAAVYLYLGSRLQYICVWGAGYASQCCVLDVHDLQRNHVINKLTTLL
jgi:hypothetical protein